MMHEPVSSIMLMERAAGIAHSKINLLIEQFPQAPILTLCGPGNNGGDGLVIARKLALQGREVTVWLLEATHYSNDFMVNLEYLRQTTAAIETISDVAQCRLSNDYFIVIDALFGTGLQRPLVGLANQMVAFINSLPNKIIISVDLPSGLSSNGSTIGKAEIIRADFTISFQCAKLCMMLPEAAAFLGQWTVADIGLHPAFLDTIEPFAFLIDQHDASIVAPNYVQFAHKGVRKTCLLVASTDDFPGATLLAAGAALRSGVGLVKVERASAMLKSLLVARHPEIVCTVNTPGADKPESRVNQGGAMGIGFGWPSSSAALEQILLDKIQAFGGALLIDAGAIRMLAGDINILKTRPANSITVITPHIGEFDAIAGKSASHYERLEKANRMATTLGIVVVLKGRFTAICTPGGLLYFNTSGNHGMAKGGSGDVLAGLLTGLLAQPIPHLQAVLLAVYLHGLAGDIAERQFSHQALQASDIVDCIAGAWQHIGSASHL